MAFVVWEALVTPSGPGADYKWLWEGRPPKVCSLEGAAAGSEWVGELLWLAECSGAVTGGVSPAGCASPPATAEHAESPKHSCGPGEIKT